MQQPPTPHATDTKTWHKAHQQLTKLNSVYATPQKLHQMPYRRYTPSYHDKQYTQAKSLHLLARRTLTKLPLKTNSKSAEPYSDKTPHN